MNGLTNEKCLQIMEFYYQNPCSVKKVYRALFPFYGQFNRPTKAAIRAIAIKIRTKFTLLDIKPQTRLRRVRTEENIAAVSASVNDDHQLSIGPLLLNNVKNFADGLRCEAFHNTAGARIETERPTTTQNFC